MCRWIAYSGGPVPVAELLYGPEHSIVKQSLTSYEGAETTNGDGFGVGWYAEGATNPSRYRSTEPAWNDGNLRDIVGELRSRLVMMHVRASSGAPVQLTNCHPFRHGRLLFMHNGVVEHFHQIRRELLLGLDASLFDHVQGTTDSELLMYLAIERGLETDPKGALERAVAHIEQTARDAGLDPMIQMSVAVADGEELCGVRYATHGEPRTLYHSSNLDTVRELYPDVEQFRRLDSSTHMLVSEPMSKLPGVWNLVPAGSFVRFQDGAETIEPFEVGAIATA
jgi:glutamine amidotransferase